MFGNLRKSGLARTLALPSRGMGNTPSRRLPQLAWQMYHEENQGRLVLNFVEGTLGNAAGLEDLRWLLSRVPGAR